jgi:ectoine hydroxylase-related dioxygenase (phytanoyl-CoA dioxygenase family)
VDKTKKVDTKVVNTTSEVNDGDAVKPAGISDPQLAALGLEPHTLAAEHRRRLDEDGFTVLEGVIGAEWLEELRQTFEQVYQCEGEEAGKEVAQMEGVRRLADLVNKGQAFDQVYLQPLLLAAVGYTMGQPFKLHSLNGHDPLIGSVQQALHADWGGERSQVHVVNSMWMLDDFTAANGATRIVPGSHLDSRRIGEIHPDRQASFPGETRLVGKAGSVGVFNGNAWHGSCVNLDGQRRRTLHCAFIARQHPQQTDQRQYLKPETADRLSPLARYILDV